MILEKAIDELEHPDWLVTENHTPEYDAAAQLGIEALKQIKEERERKVGFWADLLPGETKE
jgi:hypothetical protein